MKDRPKQIVRLRLRSENQTLEELGYVEKCEDGINELLGPKNIYKHLASSTFGDGE